MIERKFKEGKKNAKKESFVNFARGYADSHNYLSNMKMIMERKHIYYLTRRRIPQEIPFGTAFILETIIRMM